MPGYCVPLVVIVAVAAAQRPAADVDAVVRAAMRAHSVPGVAVAVVQDGTVTLRRAYGFANLETETPMRVDSIFEIASLTKQFTAAAILLLSEEGRLTIDDRLSLHMDQTPPGWHNITIRHLLTHTSGLDVSAMPRVDGAALLSVSRKQAFDHIAQQKMFAPTGRTGWYSDAGYVLLGMVIEKVTGGSYRDFIDQRIFRRLQMTQSSMRDKRRVLKRRVSTYTNSGGETMNWRRDSDYELTSAFGIHSTLADLAVWDRALRRSTLLSASSLRQMWTPARLDNGQFARVYGHLYGFGWEWANLRGAPTVAHGGASGTYLLRLVDEPLTIIVLTNLEIEERHPRALARAVAGAVRSRMAPS